MTLSRIGASFAGILMFLLVFPVNANPISVSLPAQQADLLVLRKSERALILYSGTEIIAQYDVELGSQPNGDKYRFGDGRTPEGTYFIDRRNPNSAYHLSLGISYPNEQDRAEAAAMGVDPGGDIFIHGGPTRFWDRFKPDWTAGCIAVSNREIEQIWSMVPIGTPIVIEP